ncbi:thioredoxin family protein [Flavobacterium taihuense]|uniref:Thioredoxin family protein n=1 Tax=Flavobacterium taihuense TaxID=2857508 RepID=A0ABS6XWY3_9FLAO|nr:thioredoxin fold domain-containing protein [Flavobacterium taihuense]MBW4361193.1 thioredoxin family protein [Flavobacterium taihuense]
MKKWIYMLLIFFWAIPNGFAQLKTYSFEQIDSLQTIQKRKVIMFIHTDWCKYCQAMKNSTFKNKEVIKNLNENFYLVSLNAEEKRAITFKSRKFIFKTYGNTAGINELAHELATINNQTSYPTICILNAQNDIVFQQSNYLPTKDFLIVLEKLNE